MNQLLNFNDTQFEELEQLSALEMTNEEMAMFFDIDIALFNFQAADPKSKIHYHIKRGKIVADAKEKMALLTGATSGNLSASDQLKKIKRDKIFNSTRDDIFFGMDKEQFEKIEAYIESGCKEHLTDSEALYLEFLSLIPGLYRKYGRRKTLSMMTSRPYNMSRHQAKEIFEEAINLFYIDFKIDKSAMRNLKAEILEEAALSVMKTASCPKDYEILGKLTMDSAKLRQLDIPDPPALPAGVYSKPVKVYMLEPEKVNIPAIDRHELAAQIDSLPVPESVKTRVKRDAMIEDVIPLSEILYEHKEENKDK